MVDVVKIRLSRMPMTALTVIGKIKWFSILPAVGLTVCAIVSETWVEDRSSFGAQLLITRASVLLTHTEILGACVVLLSDSKGE